MQIFPVLRRSRVRRALALVFVCAGLVAAIGAALSAWYLSSVITALVASIGLPAFNNAASTLAAASLMLAGLGAAAALVPLAQRGAEQAVQPLPALPAPAAADNLPAALDYAPAPPVPREPEPALPDVIVDAPFRAYNPIPMVSVYVDAENKPFTDTQLNTLFRLLDAEIGNQYADRFYYMDALRDNVRGFRDTYEAGGFILKDAPHEAKAAPKRRDGVEAVNTVDVAMALDILERALLGPQGQKIILVTADRDYFPLLIRLKRLGHTVQIWARQPPPRFKAFCQGMGFPLKDLDQEPLLRKDQPTRKKR